MTVKSLVLVVLSSLLLTACGNSTRYSAYQPVDLTGWHMDSVVTFTVPVSDTTNVYDVILHIRHTDGYPYQNMWLFVHDGHQMDTLEFYLADDRGQWLGNGHAIKDMPVLYREQVTIKDSMVITIQQAMRELALKGVSEVGVEVVKVGR